MSYKHFNSSETEINQLVISYFPYPIAVNYKEMHEIADLEKKTRKGIEVFEISVRVITLVMLSQYLTQDVHQVSDVELDRKLYQRLSQATLGQWVEFLFLCIRAYHNKRGKLAIPEFYELYWDTSFSPHKTKGKVKASFDRLVQIRNDLAHRLTPNRDEVWQSLYEETAIHLNEILEHISFLQNYDLIRITEKYKEDCYKYERYTGQIIEICSARLQATVDIKLDWFYMLQKKKGNVFHLHPVLIFYSGNNVGDLEIPEQTNGDVALYDRLLKESVEYIATVMRQVVERRDVDLIAQIRDLIYYKIKQLKMTRQRTTQSWRSIRLAAQELTVFQMHTAQEKYSRELYLQRWEVFNEFDNFLVSDQTCFVITGKSGVGKTSFMLSLLDSYSQQENTGFIMYDAARIDTPDTLEAMICQHLGRYLGLPEESAADLFDDINCQNDIGDRTLVVGFDAINENLQGKLLLRKIDRMLNNTFPWLKVIASCRSQAWRSLKQGVKLTEQFYYHTTGQEKFWVELREFSTSQESVELAGQTSTELVSSEPTRFNDELSYVFEKYRQVFKLQTSYQELKFSYRRILRDPLMLRLISEMYQGHKLPQSIEETDIYGQYIQKLLDTERLLTEDIALLMQEIMPVMIDFDRMYFGNRITTSQIYAYTTMDNRPLWELIHNDGLLSDGRRVNDSYVRLVDAGILSEARTELDCTINFKYDRFYEFFGAKYICVASRKTSEPALLYEKLLGILNSYSFLWGVIVGALNLELQEGNFALFDKLVRNGITSGLACNVLIAALVGFGEKKPDKIQTLIWDWSKPLTALPRSFLGQIWHSRITSPNRYSGDISTQQSIAIEAAAGIKMTDLLSKAVADVFPVIRSYAIRQVFYLWQQDQASGLEVLEKVTEYALSGSGLPNLRVLESAFALGVAILGQGVQDPATLRSLSVILRRLMRKVLLMEGANKEGGIDFYASKTLKAFLRNRMLDSLLSFIVNIMSGWGGHVVSLNFRSLENVFRLTNPQKSIVRSLIRYLDSEEADLEDQLLDISLILDTSDQIGQFIIHLALLGHGLVDLDATLPVMENLLDIALCEELPKFWALEMPLIAWDIARRQHKPDPRLQKLIERGALAVLENIDDWLPLTKKEVPTATNFCRTTGMAAMIGSTYLFQGNIESNIVNANLQNAIRNRDDEYISLYIEREVTTRLESSGLYKMAVLAVKPVIMYESPRVQEALTRLLVKARYYDPEAVEDLLIQESFPSHIIQQVSISRPEGKLSDLLGWPMFNIAYDLFLLGPSDLRKELQWLLLQIFESANVKNWLILILKELLNLLTGEIIFTVPEDAPSRKVISDMKGEI